MPLSPRQAAERLKLSPTRIRALIKDKILHATNIGIDRPVWAIEEAELERFAALDRPNHRPRRNVMKTFSFTSSRITAIDLFEAQKTAQRSKQPTEAFAITIYDANGMNPVAERAQALYLPDAMRLGIAWGADATWADVDDVESGIDMWLNDGSAWQAAN